MQILALLEGTDLKQLGHNSADYVHHLTEAVKLAFADREAYYTDPAFGTVPLPTLISSEYAAERRKLIDPDKAWPEMPPPGRFGRARRRKLRGERAEPASRARAHSYVCAADRWGNLFSATPSDGSYGAPIVPGTGLIPSNRGSQSRPDPRHPAGVAPGKRPRLTPNPALAIKNGGEEFLPFGTPGGDVQTQAMLQVLLNVFVHGQDVQSAIEQPRFASYSYPSSFAPYDYYPGRLNLEARYSGRGRRRPRPPRPQNPALARFRVARRRRLRDPRRQEEGHAGGWRGPEKGGLRDRVVARQAPRPPAGEGRGRREAMGG